MLTVMPKPDTDDTAEECLKKALELAPDMRKVLVLYELHDTAGSMDNGLTLAECLYIIEIFKHWMLQSALGGK